MAFNDTFNRLERLAHLIRLKATGNPKELARKLEVCPRTVDNLLNSLRYLGGVDIYYCKNKGSYCFDKPVKICFDLIIPLENDPKIKGGSIILNRDADFLRQVFAFLY